MRRLCLLSGDGFAGGGRPVDDSLGGYSFAMGCAGLGRLT
jgi:hypothetical protein